MCYILRYKARPSASWVVSDVQPNFEDAQEEVNKLIKNERACKVEMFKLVLTARPKEIETEIIYENGSGVSEEAGKCT